jgi:mRNA deadenylase 3'-5' endonuclease subunit Ccr4
MTSVLVATYNVLADAYIVPGRSPHSPRSALDPRLRMPALTRRVADLGADIVCLQEVEAGPFSVLQASLGSLGYVGYYSQKGEGKPDGCATFFRTDAFELLSVRTLLYADGRGREGETGHIALVAALNHAAGPLAVANTHLKWDPPGTRRDAQYGYREIRQLLAERGALAPGSRHWIVCGDFNRTPEGEVVTAMERAGFSYAHRGMKNAFTCNSSNQAKMVDYVFNTRGLKSEPLPLPPIGDTTPLPSDDEPSDHLPVVARLTG